MDVLDRFSPATRAWFTGAFAAATPAQRGAWEAASQDRDALVVAPTGSGKTLAAFLWSLDRIASSPVPAEPLERCRVLYVSPLKALAVDVERNLRAPLTGIRQASTRLGLPEPQVTVGVRSGDTSPEDRRLFARRPPDILITTPESLFLLLTSKAREALRGVETVILDEVHAVASTKRGAHLALTLERLDALLPQPARRIGLSATVRPVEEVARFLGGPREVLVVQPTATKTIEVSVVVPVEDMSALGEQVGGGGLGGVDEGTSAAGAPRRASIWPALEERVVELVHAHRSTIVFANSRRTAERLCSRLNEIDAGLAEQALADAPPAEVMAQAGQGRGADEHRPPLARAHHGSVSKEVRAQIEEALKAGHLPAVVATSSLELGIDMGAVDLVVQVESPPSVASGLQRVGRAGHQVGAVSRGVIFPKYRGDLVQAAVVAERMRDGAIEAMAFPRNPLDVLAQQIVAMVAMEDWPVEDLVALVRRAAPFATLPQSAFEAVLDMLAGRYPSDEFAELRPRVVWDRVAGVLSGRPGAQRLAVTSGGTIPDRGLFGVFLVGGEGTGRRVGELDEEMVYESRVGDVFLLGSSSWRIEDITHDRVLVSPAPGQPGKMPFWTGDALGRPLELGRAIGAFVRELGRLSPADADARAQAAGLDEWARNNLLAYLGEQKQATGHVPDDRTVLVERFRDELGDWRIAIHSPFGGQVNAPWALALSARLRQRTGVEVQSMHSDDGIVLRLPDTDEVPPGDLVVFDPDEIEAYVQDEVGGSALFASRFRECAARALLLPKRDPRKRAPLWQQRQRSAQLLQVASQYAGFPIVLETVREVLQDVFDVPGLVTLMRDIESRQVRVVEVETQAPSPFARSLLFGYVGAFMYEGDSPLAERRAQALALDPGLLAELLGRAELRELVDADALTELEASLQRRDGAFPVRHAEDVADLLRLLGDLTTDEVVSRGGSAEMLGSLEEARRVIRVRIAGEERWIAIEDAGRVSDALGVPLPVGVPEAFTEPVRDPLGDLVGRWARTHGPFLHTEVARRLGLGPAVVDSALQRLAGTGRVLHGEFRPGGTGLEWVDAEVLRAVRRKSLAKLRQEVEPVPASTLGRFLPAWQNVGAGSGRGMDALVRAVEQLHGATVPASALESLVLPARVPGYSPALLDELTASGEVLWAGAGSLPGQDGWVSLHLADTADLTLPPPTAVGELDPLGQAVLGTLDGGQALFFRSLADRVADTGALATDAELTTALWDLVWAGLLTNDTLAPLRALSRTTRSTAGRPSPTRARPGRAGGGRGLTRGGLARSAGAARSGPPQTVGRWSLLPGADQDPTRRTTAAAELLLERHGVVTRGAVVAEKVPGGFAAVYAVLKAMEEAGRCRRGYFVEGLGAAQFAVGGAVDRLRAMATERPTEPGWTTPVPGGWGPSPEERRAAARSSADTLVLAATDPANPYGAALPWPDRGATEDGQEQSEATGVGGTRGAGTASSAGSAAAPKARPAGAGHRAGRKAGALVVLVRGELVLYVERGGKTLLTFTEAADALQPAVDALALAVRDGTLGPMKVERADGDSVLIPGGSGSPLTAAMTEAGFRLTPRGLRLRA